MLESIPGPILQAGRQSDSALLESLFHEFRHSVQLFAIGWAQGISENCAVNRSMTHTCGNIHPQRSCLETIQIVSEGTPSQLDAALDITDGSRCDIFVTPHWGTTEAALPHCLGSDALVYLAFGVPIYE